MSIIECVPNFSDGQNKEVIDAIASAIKSTEGCTLLDVDAGASTNRTVYTFVGSPDAVVAGALNGAKVAYKLIDMTKHKGEHPRLGAMDVCPFIPIKRVTMEDCVACARKFSERLADELSVPSYFYGAASDREYRKTIPQIRSGEYEGLPEKLKNPDWKPDRGPDKFVPSWGATLVGARKFLIAYNVNLISTKEQAHRIALDIREQGRGDNQPGKFKCVQAIGWYLDEANLAQVSINITDFEVTGIHQVFEEVKAIAKELALPVVGSQIVGMVPLKAILDAAEHYIKEENLFILEEDQKIRLVIERLGLNSVGIFNPKERIIQYMIEKKDEGLLSLSVKDFLSSVGARMPAPGGGSVAALSASLGTSLAMMTGLLTYGNKKFALLDGEIRQLLPPVHKKVTELEQFTESDAAAFNCYMAALKLPKRTEEEQKIRNEKLEEALSNAIDVPMNLMKSVNEMWPTIRRLASICNSACLSDLQVGVRCLETAVWGGHYNVLANLKQMNDKQLAEVIKGTSTGQAEVATNEAKEILHLLNERYLKE